MKKLILIFILSSTNLLYCQKSRLPEIEIFAINLFSNKNYDQIISQIEPMAFNNISSDKLNRVISYSKIELKDFEGGIRWINQKLFEKTYMDNLYLGKGYQGLGNDSLAIVYLEKAAPFDINNNVYSIVHDIRFKQKRYLDAAVAGNKSIQWNERKAQIVSSGDYFKVAMDLYLTAAYINKSDTIGRPTMAIRADSMFAKAISINDKWPPFYINRARANNFIDYDGTKWLGKPYYEKFLKTVEILRNEKSQFIEDKNQLFEAFKYLGGYHKTFTHDLNKAKNYFLQAQEIKPESTEIKAYISELK